MPIYLISGHNGAGKSTAGKELQRRGYKVIETDFEPGLSGWVDKDTALKPSIIPPHPYPKAWSGQHEWHWDRSVLESVIARYKDTTVFLCGAANNEVAHADLFDKRFMLYADPATATGRLQNRGEENRWIEGSAELARMLRWNRIAIDYGERHGSIIINSDRPIESVVDDILQNCGLK